MHHLAGPDGPVPGPGARAARVLHPFWPDAGLGPTWDMSRASQLPSSSPLVPGPGTADPIPLSKVAVGWRRIVASVDGPARAELAREGVLPGSPIVVTGRTPLGGPVIVELGRARLAVSAQVASQVLTRSLEPGTEAR
jgi:Fe2+ transport system protein FeoA